MPAKRRFTLVEMLIVIAIIGILTTLMFPAIMRALAASQATVCVSNLKQSTTALTMYADQYDGLCVLYGNSVPWYRQGEMPHYLDLILPEKSGRNPKSYRGVTLCPSGTENLLWIDNAAYGVPLFKFFPDDYDDRSELYLGDNHVLNINAVTRGSTYVLLADSAYTIYDRREEVEPGDQCVNFVRRDEGLASPASHVISLRHNGEANLGYVDGHVGTTKDRLTVLAQSKIGVYTTVAGDELILVE